MLTFLYRLYGPHDELLYVGITRDPNARFNAHAADKAWWGDVVRHHIEEVDTPAAAQVERDAIRAERPRHNISQTPSDTVARPPRHRMPTNIDDAPEFLNAVQVASILGYPRDMVRHLEQTDSTFPRRQPLPFMKLKRFSRVELRQWIDAHSTG